MLSGCHSEQYQGPPSDHFDGKHFFNPIPFKKNSFLQVLTWAWTTQKKTFPYHLPAMPHPPVEQVTRAGEVKITFVNHSTILVQSKDFNLLTDPIWSYRAGPFSWLGSPRSRPPGIKFEEIPPIQAVIISHNHYDHLDMPTLLRLDKTFQPIFIVPLGLKKLLVDNGIRNVIELDWWQKTKIGNATITLFPTKHWSGRGLTDHMDSLWGSYGIELENKKVYFTGDSGYSPYFLEIRQRWGRPDLALLPIGSYKPAWFMLGSHMNPKEAVQAHLDLQAKYSMGIHFGTFQLSDEGIEEPVLDLMKAKEKANIAPQKFFVLPPGGNWIVK